MKLTKRKGFNFFRSYYDVYNELETDKDKVAFIDALLDRQFLGIKPTNLKGMAKFAYISQTNSIDSQVKGYEDKTGEVLDSDPTVPPTVPPTDGGQLPPTVQVEEKEKEKVQDVKEKLSKKDVDKFILWFNNTKFKYKNVVGKFKTLTPTDINNLLALKKLNYTAEDFDNAFKQMCKSTWVNDNQMIVPSHFLRNDVFARYLNASETELVVKFKAAWQ
jgi:hypothetical protein